MVIKPQDIVLLLKLLAKAARSEAWTQPSLAYELVMSASEINAALRRLHRLHLLVRIEDKTEAHVPNVSIFLSAGLPFILYRERGPEVRGLKTAWSADFVANEIASDRIVVWPYPDGDARGESLEPLYRSVPDSLMRHPDELFYEWLVCVDLMQIGAARERQFALKKIAKMLKMAEGSKLQNEKMVKGSKAQNEK